jgi:hypothetical protein
MTTNLADSQSDTSKSTPAPQASAHGETPGAPAPLPVPFVPDPVHPVDPVTEQFTPASDESSKAFSAFMAYFNLGPNRSFADTAEGTYVPLSTIKFWANRFDWKRRVQSHDARVMQRLAEVKANAHALATADWDKRTKELRELEWDTSKKLLDNAKVQLEAMLKKNSGDASFAEICRALETASKLGRLATGLATAREEVTTPAGRPLQIEITTALDRIYGPVVDITPRPAVPAVTDATPAPSITDSATKDTRI